MKEFIKSLAAELAPVWMTQQEPLKRDPKRSSRDRMFRFCARRIR